MNANEMGHVTEGGYIFGMDVPRTAAFLRKLADDMEAGMVLLQSGRTVCVVRLDNWTQTRLMLTVCERVPVSPWKLSTADGMATTIT